MRFFPSRRQCTRHSTARTTLPFTTKRRVGIARDPPPKTHGKDTTHATRNSSRRGGPHSCSPEPVPGTVREHAPPPPPLPTLEIHAVWGPILHQAALCLGALSGFPPLPIPRIIPRPPTAATAIGHHTLEVAMYRTRRLKNTRQLWQKKLSTLSSASQTTKTHNISDIPAPLFSFVFTSRVLHASLRAWEL